jgi:hypothetical protein
MPPRRNLAERREARAAGLDRFGRPLPSELAKTFDPLEFRCYRCGETHKLPDGLPVYRCQPSGGERVLVIRPASLSLCARFDFDVQDAIPYAYRCRDEALCRERERARR